MYCSVNIVHMKLVCYYIS